MTDFQSTFESPLDFTKPIGFSADMSDNIDPSNLISYQPSDTEWLTKDPFEMLPWDSFGADQTFHPFSEGAGLVELEPRTSYATSNHGSPAGYGGYTIKTEDALSDASPLSDPESEMWSPSHNNDIKSGSLSPVDAIGVTSRTSSQQNDNTTTNNTNNTSPRKPSNASSSSSTSSPSSPLASPKSTISSKISNTKSSRSGVHAQDTDAAAVMKRKKAAHNAIEKRYRTNMNAKFLALGNAIPRPGGFTSTQLASNKGPRKHSVCQPSRGETASVGRRQSEQQQQNKSEILTNALSYIHELQDENSRLKSELLVLKENLLPRGGNMMWRR
ncbi:hypothetical protein TMatcc_007012 [Talaromyces marneffei ATCC 18224]|uniref:HLH DNA binding domain protein, putative n=3 Tax=Talaromyces marneffei TaxID=37727 RepID=B6QED7_TALMQ|nr:uncharacterized protein EYB26_004007 [Talaromyces marneffei]EEA23943.1 HLH DNA binding domain protein, putative [Talaromyces marneffei ATCC 18224]KAE8553545.1 hypothetical protein EYB25_004927 [Talaromyces marneffei]QGA16340.1 hypothetical protein EYB26_004007 [Talaromyces marneffei]